MSGAARIPPLGVVCGVGGVIGVGGVVGCVGVVVFMLLLLLQ